MSGLTREMAEPGARSFHFLRISRESLVERSKDAATLTNDPPRRFGLVARLVCQAGF